jgi:hypothetical protein
MLMQTDNTPSAQMAARIALAAKGNCSNPGMRNSDDVDLTLRRKKSAVAPADFFPRFFPC